jgi:hypothetical protein
MQPVKFARTARTSLTNSQPAIRLQGNLQGNLLSTANNSSSSPAAASHLQQALLCQIHGPAEVHVVPHTLGMSAVHGRVTPKALLKLPLGQQVHPHHLVSRL